MKASKETDPLKIIALKNENVIAAMKLVDAENIDDSKLVGFRKAVLVNIFVTGYLSGQIEELK